MSSTTEETNVQLDENEVDTSVIILVGMIAMALFFAFIYYLRKPKPNNNNNNINGGRNNNIIKHDKIESKVQTNGTPTGQPMTILYGSQSGTAEGFAYQLQKEAKQHGFNAKVFDLEQFDHENDLAEEKFVLFLLATFGEGDPTDNAVNFCEWIFSEQREAESLQKVEYAVFALGNRQYEKFCEVGRRVSKRMKELSATELLEHGEGDDDGSLEDDYATWKQKMWETVKSHYGIKAGDIEPLPFEGSFKVQFFDDPNGENKEEKEEKIYTPTVIMDPKHTGGYALVVENRELRQTIDDGYSTRHIELDLSGINIKYRTADNLGVLPRNDYHIASKLAQRLGLEPRKRFAIKPKDSRSSRKLPFPSRLTVMDALLWYCDITSVPKRSVLEIFLTYATDAADKQKLKHYLNEGKSEYADDCKSMLELLEELPSVTPPFADFLEFCAKLQPRFYTISSSSKTHPKHIHITVSLSKAQKPRDRVHDGVCSTYLAKLRANKDKVAVFVRPSTFRPPWDESKHAQAPPPVVMVGPGTGVAPFRAFLQEAAHLKQAGKPVSDMVLFFWM